MRNKFNHSSTNPELTQNLDLTEKSIKKIVITIFYMFVTVEVWKRAKNASHVYI